MTGYATVTDNAQIFDHATITNSAVITDFARVYGNALIKNGAYVTDYALVSGDATIENNSFLSGRTHITGDAVVSDMSDYEVFKNNWSSGRYFTYTKSNQMWKVGCFYGTGQELIEKAYADSETSGRNYEKYVKFVENN